MCLLLTQQLRPVHLQPTSCNWDYTALLPHFQASTKEIIKIHQLI